MKRIIRFFKGKVRNFNLVAKISFRNLVRQFRRNLLLGIGIMISMAVLIVTTSFTNGLTDIIFNKVLVYMTGHIRVEGSEYTNRKITVIRDRPRIIELINRNIDGIKSIDEEVSAFGRAIGNGKSSMVALVGIAKNDAFYEETDLEEGDPRDLYKDDAFPGILLYKNAATDLNVKLNDTVRIRFQTIYGSDQAIQYRVAGLIPSENMFMDMAAFVDMERLRSDLQLKPDECLGLNIVTNYPEEAPRIIAGANRLYAALAPNAAGVKGTLSAGAVSAGAAVFAIKMTNNAEGEDLAKSRFVFIAGDYASFRDAADGIVISQPLAQKLDARQGARLTYQYVPKYGREPVKDEVVVKGIIEPVEGFGEFFAFANEKVFLDSFFWNIPKEAAVAKPDVSVSKALLPEWELLERSADTDSMMKKMLRLGKEKWTGARIDVQTMFETASMVVDLQRGLNTVSMVAVLVLFIVIFIGVVNTMRMSIRERTREIGTNRAIGMQRGDVSSVFVFEIVFLAMIAGIAGIVLGFGLMGGLSLFSFNMADNPFSMFFVNKHLYFVPTAGSILGSMITIVLIAFFIAFFTARRAAKMSAAEALRHYE